MRSRSGREFLLYFGQCRWPADKSVDLRHRRSLVHCRPLCCFPMVTTPQWYKNLVEGLDREMARLKKASLYTIEGARVRRGRDLTNRGNSAGDQAVARYVNGEGVLTLGCCSLYVQLRFGRPVGCFHCFTIAWDAGFADASLVHWTAIAEWPSQALAFVAVPGSEVMATPAQIELHCESRHPIERTTWTYARGFRERRLSGRRRGVGVVRECPREAVSRSRRALIRSSCSIIDVVYLPSMVVKV
jgi:hypothetical protein